MPRHATLWLMLTLSACGSLEEQPGPGEATPAPPAEAAAGETCVVGILTDEGVECPVLQTLRGDVYTLLGELDGRGAGDLVCACGREAEMSTCMQGTTLELTRIGSPALCP